MRTASALPVPAHVMSGVSPVAIGVFGFAPALSSRSTSAALALVHASDSGGRPKIVGHVDVCTRPDEQIGGIEIVPVRGPEQRGRAVVRPHVHVGALLQQCTNCLLIVLSRRFDETQVSIGSSDNPSHQQGEGARLRR